MNEESQLKVQQRPHQNFKVTYVQLTAIGCKLLAILHSYYILKTE